MRSLSLACDPTIANVDRYSTQAMLSGCDVPTNHDIFSHKIKGTFLK